jgi:hypothetical protein
MPLCRVQLGVDSLSSLSMIGTTRPSWLVHIHHGSGSLAKDLDLGFLFG